MPTLFRLKHATEIITSTFRNVTLTKCQPTFNNGRFSFEYYTAIWTFRLFAAKLNKHFRGRFPHLRKSHARAGNRSPFEKRIRVARAPKLFRTVRCFYPHSEERNPFAIQFRRPSRTVNANRNRRAPGDIDVDKSRINGPAFPSVNARRTVRSAEAKGETGPSRLPFRYSASCGSPLTMGGCRAFIFLRFFSVLSRPATRRGKLSGVTRWGHFLLPHNTGT